MTLLRTSTLLCVTLLTGALLDTPAAAQMAMIDKLADTTPEQRADFLTETMTSELTLTHEQLPEVQALNLEYAKLQQPLLDGSGSKLSRGMQIRKLNSEKETRLRALLTDAQWSAYEDGRSQLKTEMETWADEQPASSEARPTESAKSSAQSGDG